MPGSMLRFARNVYSQNGEDGIIAELIKRLEIPQPGTFVEFGTGNGRDLSNTLWHAERGWRGVWIEQNEESFGKAKALGDSFVPPLHTIHGTVGFGPTDNLDVFLQGRLPFDFDLLSIDVDSYDLQVWDATVVHRPKIVIIEINSGIPLGERQMHGAGKQGASFTSMVELGKKKGYSLVVHTGNLIFVEDTLFPKVGLPEREVANPDLLFVDVWAKWAAAAPK